jgi:hypothetical protein
LRFKVKEALEESFTIVEGLAQGKEGKDGE